MRADESLDQVEGNGNREKKLDSRALWEAELTGIGVGLDLECGGGEHG